MIHGHGNTIVCSDCLTRAMKRGMSVCSSERHRGDRVVPLDQFHRSKRSRTGYSESCIVCKNNSVPKGLKAVAVEEEGDEYADPNPPAEHEILARERAIRAMLRKDADWIKIKW